MPDEPRDHRTRHLRIRLTEPQYAALDAAATAADRRLSDHVRAVLFAGATPVPPPAPTPADAEDLAQVARLRELRRIGSNLNQVARRLNADQAADVGPDLEELRTWIAKETSAAATTRRRRRC